MRWRLAGWARKPFTVVVFLLAMFVIFLQLVDTGGTSVSSQPSASPLDSSDMEASPIVYPRPEELTRASLREVIDGDTIEVVLPGEQAPVRVRYYGSDSPERGERCYQDAKDRNRSLLGNTVLLLPDARDRDRYGRLLRYIFSEDGASIDSLLVSEGYAKAWRDDGNYREVLISQEETARTRGLGCLWDD